MSEQIEALLKKQIELLKEVDEYLSQPIYQQGKPTYLNTIGGNSILHKKVKEALNAPSPSIEGVEQDKGLRWVNQPEFVFIKEYIPEYFETSIPKGCYLVKREEKWAAYSNIGEPISINFYDVSKLINGGYVTTVKGED